MHAPVDRLPPLPQFLIRPRRLGLLGKTVVAAMIVLTAVGVTIVRHVFFSPDWRLHGEKQPKRTQVEQSQGASHCGWQDITFLAYDGHSYVRDTEGRFTGTPVSYAAATQLPAAATDTGWCDADRELWVGADSAQEPTSVYIVEGDNVERWPRFDIGCI